MPRSLLELAARVGRIVGHQRAAAGLVAGDRAQLALDSRQLDLEHVDDLQCDPDPLVRVDRELQGVKELAAGEGAQIIRGAAIPW